MKIKALPLGLLILFITSSNCMNKAEHHAMGLPNSPDLSHQQLKVLHTLSIKESQETVKNIPVLIEKLTKEIEGSTKNLNYIKSSIDAIKKDDPNFLNPHHAKLNSMLTRNYGDLQRLIHDKNIKLIHEKFLLKNAEKHLKRFGLKTISG